jgi:hypothetical protein
MLGVPTRLKGRTRTRFRKSQAHGSKLTAQSQLFFLEVLILEDVWRCAYQAKADFLLAGFAIGKALAADHDNLVSLAVLTVVEYFVDAGLADNFSTAIAPAAIRSSAAMVRALDVSWLELKRGLSS